MNATTTTKRTAEFFVANRGLWFSTDQVRAALRRTDGAVGGDIVSLLTSGIITARNTGHGAEFSAKA
jgi:hypothetical protein